MESFIKRIVYLVVMVIVGTFAAGIGLFSVGLGAEAKTEMGVMIGTFVIPAVLCFVMYWVHRGLVWCCGGKL